MDLGLQGKKAIVVGGARGIGYAVAEILAREGAKIIAAARRRDALEALAGEIRRVSNANIRKNEAARLGFVRSVDSDAGQLKAALALGLNW